MIRLNGLALAMGATMVLSTGALAQKAENGLLGVKLYDAGTRVVNLFGTPDEIQAVAMGGGQAGGGMGAGAGAGGARGGFGPGGPGGMPPGGPGGFGAPGGGGGKAGGGGASAADFQRTPFGFADTIFQGRGGMSAPGAATGPSGGGPGFGAPGGMPGGGPGFGAPGGGAPGGGTPGRGFGGNADSATYTRWVYNRGASKYGFIIDKFGRVVQIEAIGLQNAKVKTSRGIGFGATFAQVVKKHNSPDGYEIAGDNVLMKYLTKQQVAFRLSRLGPKKPQVVTGIVVAAGKG